MSKGKHSNAEAPAPVEVTAPAVCDHTGIGLPGCVTCDPPIMARSRALTEDELVGKARREPVIEGKLGGQNSFQGRAYSRVCGNCQSTISFKDLVCPRCIPTYAARPVVSMRQDPVPARTFDPRNPCGR